MKKKRYSAEQIVADLKPVEMGMPVADLIRQLGISETTYYRWKKKYGGLESDQVGELKQVLEENTPAEEARRGTETRQGGPSGRSVKKIPRPLLMKQVVDYVRALHGYSERRACKLTRQHRSPQRMHEIVATRI